MGGRWLQVKVILRLVLNSDYYVAVQELRFLGLPVSKNYSGGGRGKITQAASVSLSKRGRAGFITRCLRCPVRGILRGMPRRTMHFLSCLCMCLGLCKTPHINRPSVKLVWWDASRYYYVVVQYVSYYAMGTSQFLYLRLWRSSGSGALGNVEYPFVAITPRSTDPEW